MEWTIITVFLGWGGTATLDNPPRFQNPDQWFENQAACEKELMLSMQYDNSEDTQLKRDYVGLVKEFGTISGVGYQRCVMAFLPD